MLTKIINVQKKMRIFDMAANNFVMNLKKLKTNYCINHIVIDLKWVILVKTQKK